MDTEVDLEQGMDKTHFVVGMLVALKQLTWEQALPIMAHFDSLDVRKTGRLRAIDLSCAGRHEKMLQANQKVRSSLHPPPCSLC